MKLITFKNRRELEEFSDESIVTVGLLYSNCGIAEEKFRGVYTILSVPFINRMRNYTDPETFEMKNKMCRLRILLRLDKVCFLWKNLTLTRRSVWLPVIKS